MNGGAARAAAAAAAERSGVRVVAAESVAEQERFLRVVDEVWRPAPTDPPVTPALLRALVHSGSYCTVAYSEDRPVAVCLGWVALHPTLSVHSHIAGVTAAGLGRQIGFALKLDQRAWALERGIGTITWTFDPLVRRNAYFNLAKLGAIPLEYLVDFYGEMDDVINAGQGSDRLLASWPLLGARVVAAAHGQVTRPDRDPTATVLLDDDAEVPVLRAASAIGPTALVRVPADVEALRLRDPGLAVRWRHAVRDTMGELMGIGWSVTGATRDGWYVLQAPEGGTS